MSPFTKFLPYSRDIDACLHLSVFYRRGNRSLVHLLTQGFIASPRIGLNLISKPLLLVLLSDLKRCFPHGPFLKQSIIQAQFIKTQIRTALSKQGVRPTLFLILFLNFILFNFLSLFILRKTERS